MRNAETLKSSDSPAPKPAAAGRRFLPLALGLLAAAFSFTPTPVHADTPLPQGWTSDSADGDAQADLDVTPTQATVDATVTVTGDEYVDTDPVALSDFRDPLTPYGVWADDPTYGTVWVPNGTVVGADFAPYQTAGRWELDANGDWMWVSDYDWGYIPFHYGRWVYIGGRGWSWIPGRTYAPAWVTWRLTDYGYVGWAPMAPSWYWFGGSAVTVWSTPSSAYVFCPSGYVFHRHVHTYVVRDRDIVQRIGAHSRPYRPAQPTAGGGASARPYKPASPSLAEAKVPSGSAPQVRGAPDPRAAAYSRKSTTAQARTMSREAARNMPSHVASAPSQHDGRAMPAERAERGATHMSVPGQTSHDKPTNVPERQTSRPAETRVTQPSAPSHVTTTPSRPSTTTSRPSTTPSRPSTTTSRPSTTTSRPSSSPSRPSFSPPSRPSSSPSRSSSSPSRPSFSPSRPSHRR